jgi:HlyD family secretion protein
MKTTKSLIMLTAILVLVLTACANQAAPTPQPAASDAVLPDGIIAEGKIKPVQAVNLSFQVRGMVEEVNVKIGDLVKKDDVLARLANYDVAMAQLTAAKLELLDAQNVFDTLDRTGGANLAAMWTSYMSAQETRATAELAWEALNLDDIENRIDDAKAEVEDRQTTLTDAEDEFDKYKGLDKDNARRKTAEDDLETAQENYNGAVRNLEELTREGDTVRVALDTALAAEAEAKHQYELSANGANSDQLAFAQARLDNANAQIAAAEDTLGNYVITAPFDGVVAEVAVAVGEQATAETRAVSVVNTSAWIIETTDVTELEVVNLAVGQKVTFTADALSDASMTGVVTEISQSSILQGGDVIYVVRIQANDVDPRVKWGMTVEVVFEPLD